VLASAPFYFAAWQAARRRRIQLSTLMLFAALFAVSILGTWPRGPFSPSWYVQPFLAMLATSCTGIVPGLSFTLVATTALLVQPILHPDFVTGLERDVWTHTTSLAAVTLASALTGALLHQLLLSALLNLEAQRRLNQTSRRALRHRERLLRHAMRVDTVGDLAGLVTHQLRNSFQVMMGHVTLGADGDADELSRRLALVGETLDQSRPLLDQLMSLAHPDDGRPETGDLNVWIASFGERARRVMPSTILLDVELAAEPLRAHLDPHGLDHALWNLVINARHAMPEGGSLRIRTEAVDGGAVVTVSDTGTGIPLDLQPQIFDPYFTTKPRGRGTGLGLAAVDRFVRSSRGRVELDSEPGHGATFRLWFPEATKSAVQTA